MAAIDFHQLFVNFTVRSVIPILEKNIWTYRFDNFQGCILTKHNLVVDTIECSKKVSPLNLENNCLLGPLSHRIGL